MKKILSIVLALMLLVSACVLTSCEEMTAYELIHSAIAKMETLDSFEADVVMKMDTSIKMQGATTTVEVPMTMNVKASGLKGETPLTSGSVAVTTMGVETKGNVYSDSKDVYVATEVMGQSVKLKMSADSAEAGDYDLTGTTDSFLVDIPEDALKNVAIVESENGTKTVEVALDPADADQVVPALVGEKSHNHIKGDGVALAVEAEKENGS